LIQESSSFHSAVLPEIRRDEFEQLRDFIQARSGIHLGSHKSTLLRTRLLKRLRALNLANYGEYYHYLQSSPYGDEIRHLLDAITTNVTEFFREPAHFDFLKNVAFPRDSKLPAIRILSAGCSTGEEAYSIAMCAIEHFGIEASRKVQIIAGDISTAALAQARAAMYPIGRVKNLTPTRLQTFFLRGTGSRQGLVRVAPEVQSMVTFQPLNLVEPLNVAGPFNAVFCRNVAIYFNRETQIEIYQRLQRSLVPGGHLFIGHSESMMFSAPELNFVQPSVYRNKMAG
jgi:chemotaxis protein methyltransferase CheR